MRERGLIMRELTIAEKADVARTIRDVHYALNKLLTLVSEVDEESIDKVINNDLYPFALSFDEVICALDFVADEIGDSVDQLKIAE